MKERDKYKEGNEQFRNGKPDERKRNRRKSRNEPRAIEWKGLPCRSFRRALRLRVQQRTRMRQPAQHRNDNRQIAGHLRSCHVVRRLPNGERVRDAAHCASAEARTQSAACEAAARACSCLPSGLLGCRKGVQSAFLVGLLATALLARAPRAQALHISSPSAKRRTRRQPCRPERHEACMLCGSEPCRIPGRYSPCTSVSCTHQSPSRQPDTCHSATRRRVAADRSKHRPALHSRTLHLVADCGARCIMQRTVVAPRTYYYSEPHCTTAAATAAANRPVRQSAVAQELPELRGGEAGERRALLRRLADVRVIVIHLLQPPHSAQAK